MESLKLSSPFRLISKSVKIFFAKEYFWKFVLISLPLIPFHIFFYFRSSFLNSIMGLFNSTYLTWINALIYVLYFTVGILLAMSGIKAVKSVVMQNSLNLKSVFSFALKNFWKFMLLNIIIFVIFYGGLILLIIPGLIFLVWFAFSTYIFVDKEIGIKKSILESRRIVKGRFWQVAWRLLVIEGVWGILSVLLRFIPYEIGNYIMTLISKMISIPIFLLYKELSDNS
jgi:hypothetical protein